MKDVKEDNYISALHLFHGNVDIPPSFHHVCLEELWDEEEEPEEIETVMKFASSASHHYLDVFSKVKADKPPLYHACAHHIKLEGLYLQLGSSTPCQLKIQRHSGPKFQRM
ncbi:hypothetical protein O181_037634 [Austropuccinia psidii MF-1]|uniref:Uncharacterized protein n=1 Tax=Austropuccinia psidii MF-1 TaxID=1389203 RepID=A0A9Q3HCS6_9BASI|nr:hypothetical protein [Austropuccinia psidii MF-1]